MRNCSIEWDDPGFFRGEHKKQEFAQSDLCRRLLKTLNTEYA